MPEFVDGSRVDRNFFCWGGRLGHLKAIMQPPQGFGGGSPLDCSGFIFKRFKVLENESIFKNSSIFLPRKIHFSNKTFEKCNIFYKNF